MPAQGKRRALGQHFLKDQALANAIAERGVKEALESGCKSLLEIGPGRGAITLPLFEELKKNPSIRTFQLVEKDDYLAQKWKEQDTGHPFSVIAGDFLEIPEAEWLGQNDLPLAVVSNLPYSSGTAILDRLARHPESIPVMVLMFQAEVAKRLRAEPSTKERGSLSIWIQNLWDVEKFLAVPPQAFAPPPEVNSEVVILKRRAEPRIPNTTGPEDEKIWESFLKTCFAHRRKMLRSSLPWRNALELSGVDGTKRAEALQWLEWEQLFRAVKQSPN
ncbi:MAG: 16S rRNA (adenine(1518)-N(6)/adenine(1519)-N(6))-dimethyltransferase RsmA [Bdellovibrionia bacterium]